MLKRNSAFMRLVKKVVIFVMVFGMCFYSFPINELSKIAFAADSQFNINLSSIGSAWAVSDATINGNTITTTGQGQALIAIVVDDADLQSAIDLGTVSLSSTIDINVTGLEVQDPLPDDLHTTALSVRFGTDVAGAYSAAPSGTDIHYSSADESFSLGTSASIPAGTRCILLEVGVTTYEQPSLGIVTTTLSNSYTVVPDNSNPTISSSYNTNWTKEDVTVTITAEDNIGVKGIYIDTDTQAALGSTYTYTITNEGDNAASFFSRDFAGNLSTTSDINVNNIDKTIPTNISIDNVSSSDWTNETVTVTFPAIAQPTDASPESYEFSANGTDYLAIGGNVHTVMHEGEVTWTYRRVDEAGNVSANTVNAVTRYDVTNPSIDNISVSRQQGKNTYSITVSDSYSGVNVVKYAAGVHTADFFASGGNVLNAPYQIVSTTAQSYTVYVEDIAGNSEVQVIDALNILPTLGVVGDITIDEDTNTIIEINATDDTTVLEDMVINATSSDASVVENTAAYFSGGKAYIDISPLENKNTNGSQITITINCQDAHGESSSNSFLLEVIAVNDAPDAHNDSESTTENTAVTISVLNNDTDAENDGLNIQSFTQGANGTVTQSGNDLIYTPNHGWAGNDSFTYVVSDGLLTSQAMVSVAVNNHNDAPEASNDNAATNEDTTVVISVLNNDTDKDLGIDPAENLAVSLDEANMPSNGSVVLNGNQIEYTPNQHYFGSDSFKYIVTDNQGLTDTATVYVEIQSVNDAPVIANAPANMAVQEDSVGNVFTFDISDVETATSDLMVQVVSENTSLIRNDEIVIALDTATGECSVIFAPAANKLGTVNLKLLISDGIETVTQFIPVNIQSVNDTPAAENDDMTGVWKVYEDTPINLDLSILRENDTDADNDALTVTGVSAVSSGAFSHVSGETFRYTPASNYNGAVTFTYTVSDGSADDNGQVTFEIYEMGDAPVLTINNLSFNSGEYIDGCDEDNFANPISITVSDIDTPLSNLIVTVESSNETLVSSDNISIVNNNDGTYDISLGLTEHKNGESKLYIYLSDGVNTVYETVSYTVAPVQDAPAALNDEYTVGRATIEYIIPIANDYDFDDEALTLLNSSSFTQPQEGTITVHENGFLYRAPQSTVGDYTFTYTITDGIDEATATVTLHVVETGEINGPIISAISDIDVMENHAVNDITFTAEDDDGVVSVIAVSSDQSIIPDSNISISNNVEGEYTLHMSLQPDVTGTTYITVTATDYNGHSSIRQFAVNVYPENETPVANDDTLTSAAVLAFEDTDFTFTAANLLANDTDTENDALSVIFVSDPSDAYSYITNNGTTYTLHPSPNRNGNITFTYYITDGYTNSLPGTVTVYLTPVNDRPDGDNDYYTLPNDTGAEVLNVSAAGVLGNDDDVDGDELTVSRIGTQPKYGTVTLKEDGSFTYTRNQIAPGTYGEDSFTYYVTDGMLEETNPTTVHIRTGYEPDFHIYYRGRTCYEDAVQFSINVPVGESNGYLGTYEITGFSGLDLGQAAVGTSTDRTNLTILFTPNPSANGYDSFTYEVTDTDTGRTKTNTVGITIIPVNDAPYFVILPETPWTENEDGSKTLSVQVADDDHDVSDLEFEVYLTGQNNSNPVALDEDIVFTRDAADPSKATITIPFLPNKSGTFSVVFNVSDGIDSTTAVSDGTVLPVDDPPVTPDKTETLKEDTSDSIDIMEYVSDIDTDKSELVLTISVNPEHGSAEVSGDRINYVPDFNFYGTDSLTYRVSSSDGTIYSEGIITYEVEAENDAPYIYDIDYYVVTDEDTTCTLNFKSFDYEDDESTSDANETVYSFTVSDESIVALSGITMSVSPTDPEQKILTIVPNENMYGTIDLTIIATDSEGAVTTLDAIVNVVSVNDAPTAEDDTAVTDEDNSVEIDVLSNDSDIEDDLSLTDDLELSVIEVTKPLHGRTSINSQTGIITYTPYLNFNGTDSFTYILSDSFGETKTATVDVTINPVNDPPVANNDQGEVLEGETVVIDLIANDTDVEITLGETTDELTIVSVGASVEGGTISFANGQLTYTANGNLDTDVVDMFSYTITDGEDTDTANIIIFVEQVNDPPAAESDETNSIEVSTGTWIFDEDTTGIFIVDIEDAETYANQLLVSISSDGQAVVLDSNISISNTPTYDKKITLVPRPNAHGEFNITFTVGDGQAETTVVFPVKINPVNDVPVLTVYDLTTIEEQSAEDTAQAQDVETAVEDLVYSIETQPTHGTVSIVPSTGQYTYTPNTDYVGSDSFRITVVDEDGAADTETVNVTITQANDTPTAADDNYTLTESETGNFDVLANDTDPDIVYGDSLTIVSVTQPDHGAVTIVGNQLKYVPEQYNNNTVTFTYTISDEDGAQSTASVTVDFTSVGNDPANGNDTYTIDEDDPVDYFDVLLNDDVDIDPALNETVTDVLTLLSVTPANPVNSLVCEIEGNKLKYQPAENFFGQDVITYTMKDANTPDGTEFTFTATINVNSVNDIPTISDIADETTGHLEDNNVVTSAAISDIETNADALTLTAAWDNDTLVNDVIISDTGAVRTITVVPEINMYGTAIITVTVKDEDGAEAVDTFVVNIAPQNDTPIPDAGTDSVSTDENTAVYIDVLKNDDVDDGLEGDDVRIVPTSLTLTSSVDYGGTYQVVQRQVERTRLNIDGTMSTVSITRDVIEYTPNADWAETESKVQVLSYQMYEQSNPSVIYDADQMVEITINPVNDTPSIDIDLAGDVTDFDEDTVSSTINIIVNDEEDANGTLFVEIESITEHEPNSLPASPLVLASDITISTTADESIRSLVMTSQSNESGVFDLELKITDSEGLVSYDTITVTVNPTQDAPMNGDDLFTTAEDTAITLDVLANDDVDTTTQGSLSTLVAIETAPLHGTAVIDGNNVVYTPDLNYFNDGEGPDADDSFEYRMRDGNGAEAVFTVTMYVTPVNDDPVLVFSDDEAPNDDFKVSTPEATVRVIKLYFTDVDDPDADIQMTGTSSNPLIVNGNTGGISISGMKTDGFGSYFEVTLTPFGKFNGTTSLTFTATDSTTRSTGIYLAQSVQMVELTITPVNDAPDAIADSLSGNEGTTLTLNVLQNDQDIDITTNPDGEELRITDVDFAATEVNTHVGTLSTNGDKDRIIFTPSPAHMDWNGILKIEYEITDLGGLTDTVVSTLTINQVNDAPVAFADTGVVAEDAFIDINILANDTDIDMDPSRNNMPYTEFLTYDPAGFGGLDNGSVTVVDGTTIRYTPDSDFNGEEVFTYTLKDNNGASATGTVTVTVTPADDNPTAVNDDDSTKEDTAVTITVLDNDSDTDSDAAINLGPGANDGTLNITLVDGQDITSGSVDVGHGTVTLTSVAGKDALIFTPDADFVGSESFEYTVSNNDNNIDTATVGLIVNNENDAPTAQPDTRTIDEDAVAQVFDIAALIDDIDLDVAANNEVLTISIDSATVSGDVSVDDSAKEITYTPQANWNGEFVITYRVTDDAGLFATNTITITVNPMDDNPTAAADIDSTNEDTAVTITVLDNDSDTDSNTTLNKNLAARNDGTLNITLVEGNDITTGSVDVGSGVVTLTSVAGKDALIFTPDADFVGSESFEYTVSNNDNNTATATVSVTVNNENDAPTADDYARTIDEDAAAQIFDIDFDGLDLIDDVDLDVPENGEALTVSIVSSTVPADVSLNTTTNVITYTPQANWNGTFEIVYRVTDNSGAADDGTITVTVTPTYDNPTAVNDDDSTNEDTAVTITVLDNDSDTDSDTTLNQNLGERNDDVLEITHVDGTLIAVGSPVDVGNGTVSLVESGGDKLVFTPDADFVGSENFEYTVSNNDNKTDTATVSVTVNNENDAPTAQPDTRTIDEDAAVQVFDIAALIDDIDLDVAANNEVLTISIDSATVSGDVSVDDSAKEITYTPQANWNGEFAITYRVTDDAGLFATNTITITVNPMDDNPTAVTDTGSTNEDEAVTINVLSNDSDIDSNSSINLGPGANNGILEIVEVDGQAITVGGSVTVANGSVELIDDGGHKLIFTPNTNYQGSSSFTYTVRNSDGNTATATVNVEIDTVNDNPVAVNDSATTDEDAAITFNIINNDSDVDILTAGDSISIAEADITGTAHGSISYSSGELTYTPDADFNGTETLTYILRDSEGGTDTATITITVTPVDDNPTAETDTGSTNEDTAVTITVLDNDSDTDSNVLLNLGPGANDGTLNITLVEGQDITSGSVDVGNGVVMLTSVSGKDALIFTPDTDFVGSKSFTYTVSNNDNNTATATVNVTVNNENDAPTADDYARTIDEDAAAQTFDVDFDGLDLIDDIDLDVPANGEALTVSIVSSTVPADVSLNTTTNVITYTPQANWNGTFEIVYRVTDNSGAADEGTITVTVNSVGDAPILGSDAYTVNEDEYTSTSATPWYNMDVLSNDTDVDETTNAAFEDLKITNVEYAEDNVSLVISADKKSIDFQADENWNGIVNYTYTVTDAYGIERTMASTITVNQVNDAPVSVNDITATKEDVPITFSIIGNDSDVDTDLILNADPNADSITINQTDVLGTAHGTISLTNGVLTYTPEENWNGVENLTYTLLDEHGGTDTAKITITVLAQNDDPQANDDGASLDEDDAFTDIYPLLNDYNPDGDSTKNVVPDTRELEIDSINLTGMPADAGNITIVDDHLHYVPNEHYEGTFTIQYTCINGNGGTDTADITIYVAQVYDNPVGEDIGAIMDEDTVYTVDLDDYISDVDAGTTFTLTVINNGSHGSASIDPATHVLTYTPEADYNGEDTIVYLVEDNQLLSDTGTITITINQVNDAPVTADDSGTTDEDTAITLNVIANDSDIDTDINLNADPAAEKITVKADGFRNVDNGTVEVLPNNTSILFTPDENWHGTEEFVYTCVDVTGIEVEATVTVTVNSVNDRPIFNTYETSLDEDSSITYTAESLIFDPDIASIDDEVILSAVSQPNNGMLEIINGSKIIYTPDANFNGDDTFTIQVEDLDGETTTETFNMVINQVNDRPRALDDNAVTKEDNSITIDVLENDSDIDMRYNLNKYPHREDMNVEVISLGSPENGTVRIDEDNNILYTPKENFHGVDGFEYTVVDNSGFRSTAYVEVVVESVVDIPVLIEFTTKYLGDAYRSGSALSPAWSVDNPDNIELLYTLSFFDGTEWVAAGEGLSQKEYEHILEEYISETDKAQFSVFGTMPDGTKTNVIYSDEFIVDNVAPVETKYEVTLVSGLFTSSMIVDVDNGKDMIEFEYLYQVGNEGDLKAIRNKQFIIGNRDQRVNLYARDMLGNKTLVDTISFGDYRTMPVERGYCYLLLLGAGLIILLLLRYRNIKFVFNYADGKTKTIRYYRRHKDSGIDVKLKDKWFEDALSLEMTMKKRITEKMLGNTVRVAKNDTLLKTVNVPESMSNKFKDRII